MTKIRNTSPFFHAGGPLSPFSPSSLRYPSPFPQSNGPPGPANPSSGTPGYPVNRTSPFPGAPSSTASGTNGPMSGSNPAFHSANGPPSAGMPPNMYPGGNSHMTSPNPQQNPSSHSTAMGAGTMSSSTSVTVKQEVMSSPGTPGSIGSPVPSAPMMNPTGPQSGYPGGVSPGHPYAGAMQNSSMARPTGPVNTSSSLAQLQQMQMRHNPQGYGPSSSSYGPVANMNQPGPGMGGPSPGMHPGEIFLSIKNAMNLSNEMFFRYYYISIVHFYLTTVIKNSRRCSSCYLYTLYIYIKF